MMVKETLVIIEMIKIIEAQILMVEIEEAMDEEEVVLIMLEVVVMA